MATRLLAGGFLLASGLIAWVAVTSVLAARTLQAIVGLSVLYVGYLAYRGWQLFVSALRAAAADGADLPTRGRMPFISVVVPARDEAAVISEVVGDLVRQRYADVNGVRRYEVIVVDGGSSDGTAGVVERSATAARAPEGLVAVLRRSSDDGPQTKGNALAAAMPQARGALVAALDADSRVAPGFLARIVAAWERDPGAAAVQARRQPSNAGVSWLTAAQAEEQLMDLASQCGRRNVDGTAELRGNGMVVRRDVLERVGGWSRTAITEDLELSTRLAAAGEHVAMAPEVVVEEEAVESLAALWGQRLRWSEGSLRRLMGQGPGLLAGPAPAKRKLDFLAFAAEFLIPPLFATSIVASLLTIPLPARMDWTVPVSLFLGYGMGSFLLALAGLAGAGCAACRWPAVPLAARSSSRTGWWSCPSVLLRITFLPPTRTFRKTPRMRRGAGR